MVIAITGATGNMGSYFMWALNNSPKSVQKVKILCRDKKKADKLLNKYKEIDVRTEVVIGDISDRDACNRLVKECDIVFNICAVIPPTSDSNPQATIACNVTGVRNLISAIAAMEKQPALVHISSVAVYGNRAGDHIYGRVGEPLVSGPFELYSATKILGEYAVLQSTLKKWVVLRQTAIYHYNMFSDNIKDGLMFHTPHLAPLEWVTVKDSGTLLFNLLKGFAANSLPENFWKHVYNIGGGKSTRAFGYQTYDMGFKIIGGGFKNFFKPWYNATRNFHGMFYTDSDDLENILHFRSQSADDYWKEMADMHKIYKMGKIIPKCLLAAMVIKPLLKDENAPSYWMKMKDEARAEAYFGGFEKYAALKNLKWRDIELPTEIPDPVEMTHEQNVDAYGYDISKTDDQITVDDLKTVAEAHAGKLLTPSRFSGDMYQKMAWRTVDGEIFYADAHTVLRAGHWENPLYHSFRWDFDRLSKTDQIFARIWYDSHDKDEDNVYLFDDDFKAYVGKINDVKLK